MRGEKRLGAQRAPMWPADFICPRYKRRDPNAAPARVQVIRATWAPADVPPAQHRALQSARRACAAFSENGDSLRPLRPQLRHIAGNALRRCPFRAPRAQARCAPGLCGACSCCPRPAPGPGRGSGLLFCRGCRPASKGSVPPAGRRARAASRPAEKPAASADAGKAARRPRRSPYPVLPPEAQHRIRCRPSPWPGSLSKHRLRLIGVAFDTYWILLEYGELAAACATSTRRTSGMLYDRLMDAVRREPPPQPPAIAAAGAA